MNSKSITPPPLLRPDVQYNLFSVKDLKRAMSDLGKPIKKSLGQNYLINSQAAETLAQTASQIASGRPVIEIGSGLGNLTQAMLKQKIKVLALETDKLAVNFLEKNLKPDTPDLTIMHQNFLEDFVLPAGFNKSAIMLGNLPYNITSPILFKCFETFSENITDLIFMMQKEVADRILSSPGIKSYGKISTLANYHSFNINPILKLKPGSFYPRPQIDSTVLHFKLRQQALSKHYYVFKAMVHNAFFYRRKQLKKALFLKHSIPLNRKYLKVLTQKWSTLSAKRADELYLKDYLFLTEEYASIQAQAPTSD